MKITTLLLVLSLVHCALGQTPPQPSSQDFVIPQRRPDGMPLSIPKFSCQVLRPAPVRSYAHDTGCFTQGLYIDEQGQGFETSGGLNHSNLRQFDPASGKVLRTQEFSKELWAEGVTGIGSSLLVLTWQNRQLFECSKSAFALVKKHFWPAEAWGAATDDSGLVWLSDGSDQLCLVDPGNRLNILRRVKVTEGGRSVDLLNELEWVDGFIYANLWLSDYVAVIRPADGEVVAWVDFSNLLSAEEQTKCDVLNGVALDRAAHCLHVTGKFWPKVFVFEVPQVQGNP